jgi:DNA-binding transcriptional ArsR family regulator
MVVDTSTDEGRNDLVFHALSDATRRDIVRLVMQAEYSVSDLARLYPMSFAAVQKHVAVLERADLVSKRPQGRERMVRGRIEAIRRATRLFDEIEAIWRGRLQRFGEVLADDAEDADDADDAERAGARPDQPSTRHLAADQRRTDKGAAPCP